MKTHYTFVLALLLTAMLCGCSGKINQEQLGSIQSAAAQALEGAPDSLSWAQDNATQEAFTDLRQTLESIGTLQRDPEAVMGIANRLRNATAQIDEGFTNYLSNKFAPVTAVSIEEYEALLEEYVAVVKYLKCKNGCKYWIVDDASGIPHGVKTGLIKGIICESECVLTY
jgi:hypothetical protein